MTEPTPPIEQHPPTDTSTKANPSSPPAALQQQQALTGSSQVYLPRITIKFCTQCKWMLRAAYFGQELLSTFGTSLGEVSLVPTTGGVFTVTMFHAPPSSSSSSPPPSSGTTLDTLNITETLLWDRKTHGGFPEVKQLKALVRNIIDPSRDLGHVDRALKASNASKSNTDLPQTNQDKIQATETADETKQETSKETCQDCQ